MRGIRETKYNVNKDTSQRTYDGIIFDSALEMRYYRDVILPKFEDGEITYYELQKPYILQPKFEHDGENIRAIVYTADFYIEYSDGHAEVIDTKGMADATAKLKRKMFWYQYPDLDYRWVCYSKIDGGWCDYDHVQKQRNVRRRSKKSG